MDTDKIAEELRTANMIAFLAALLPTERRGRAETLVNRIEERLR